MEGPNKLINEARGALYGLVLGLATVSGLAGCGPTTTEMQFEKSPYGIEIRNMMTVCMDLQRSGNLPGLAGGKDRAFEFRSDEIDFSAKNDVSYPLRLNCMVKRGAELHRFVFVKETPTADWEFVK